MPNILVVDDVKANVELLTLHLQDEQYDVIPAQNGQEALDLLIQKDIDLILLDVMMPGMSGLDVLGHIKRNPDSHLIPVILVTANANDDNVAEGLDLGAYDYIIKPYSLVVLLARVRAALRERERLELLEKWATTDPLTELCNRRHFFDLAGREFERARRGHEDLSFIMADIDHFKRVNDEYGHRAGDKALTCLADLLRNALRKVDFCGRFGGEEFVICLPDTILDVAMEVAERIRVATEGMEIQGDDFKLSITISLGVACFEEDNRLEDILNRADDALYQAKQSGRNQTQCQRTGQ